jgi:hypothetical protein
VEKLIDVSSKECENIHSVAYSLESFARSFGSTGNTSMSGSLYELAQSLHNSADELHKVVGITIGDEYHKAQQSSVNVLMAALAGVKVHKSLKH